MRPYGRNIFNNHAFDPGLPFRGVTKILPHLHRNDFGDMFMLGDGRNLVLTQLAQRQTIFARQHRHLLPLFDDVTMTVSRHCGFGIDQSARRNL